MSLVCFLLAMLPTQVLTLPARPFFRCDGFAYTTLFDLLTQIDAEIECLLVCCFLRWEG